MEPRTHPDGSPCRYPRYRFLCCVNIKAQKSATSPSLRAARRRILLQKREILPFGRRSILEKSSILILGPRLGRVQLREACVSCDIAARYAAFTLDRVTASIFWAYMELHPRSTKIRMGMCTYPSSSCRSRPFRQLVAAAHPGTYDKGVHASNGCIQYILLAVGEDSA